MATQVHETTRRLRQLLREDMQPGAKLPNEQTLATTLGVSRATIREAVSRLVVEGSLIKRWGVGTFVIDTKQSDSFGLLSFRPGIVASLSATGGEVTMPFSQMTTGAADASLFPEFPTSRTLHLQRTYAVDGQAAIYVRDVMVMEHDNECIDTGSGDWMSLLIPDLLAQIGLKFDRLQMSLNARACTAEEAEHLALTAKDPVLSSQGQALDESDRVLLHVHSAIRTDIAQPFVSSSPTQLTSP